MNAKDILAGCVAVFLLQCSYAQCTLDLGNDTVICPGNILILDAGGGYDSYLWQNGTTTPVINASTPGIYWCEVTEAQGNLIPNGDFGNATTSFTSDYVVGTGGTWGQLSNEGTYAVSTSPNLVHTNFPSCPDHTTGTGNMLVVNGASTLNQNIWCETVTVTPNTDYVLSAWFLNFSAGNPADISFVINGTTVGTNYSPNTNTGCNWENHFVNWNSGANTSAQICFVNQSIAVGGNDFAIDDISFGSICTVRDSVEVTAGDLQAAITAFQNESCVNSNNGMVTFSGIVGTGGGPYTVTWFDPTGSVHATDVVNSGGSATQNDLYQGIWNVTIADDNGCDWDTTFFIQAGAINVSTSINHPQCWGTSTGSVTGFSTTTGNFSFTITDDSNGNVVNTNGSNTANSLAAGFYTVSIIDPTGCTISTQVELIDPLPIELDIAVVHPECYGYETGIAYVTNVFNYQGDFNQIFYGWDPNPNGTNGLNQDSIWGLPAGEYNLEIVDDFGCSNQETFFINNPDSLVGVLEVVSPTYCRTAAYQSGVGEVAVTTAGPGASGTGNVTYLWRHLGNGDESNSTTFIVTAPGFMEATLTDDNGCVFKDTIYVDSLNPIAAFTLNSPQFTGPGLYEGTEELELELINESLNFAKASYALSDTIFNHTWDKPTDDWNFVYDYSQVLTTTLSGEHVYEVCLVAKNFNDCRHETCVDVIVHEQAALMAPNVFTPGTDPNRNFFFPSAGIENFHCVIFNRYGVKVYELNDITEQWDGTNIKNGRDCSEGTYFYSYTGESTSGKLMEGQGEIQLIRP